MSTALHIDFPELFDAQYDILDSPARFNIVAGGKDAGKTTLAIDIVLASHFGALNGFHTALLVPDDDALLRIKRQIFSLVQPLLVGKLDRPRVDLSCGGSITFLAMDDPKNMRLWEQVALIVVDDAAQIEGIHDHWEDMLRPMLSQARGHAWFLAKPAGVRNGFYKLWSHADADWRCFTLPSSANPHADAEQLEKDRLQLSPDAFKQERMGEFVDAPIVLSAGQSVIGIDETFVGWCERLAAEGLKVDGHAFTLDNRPAMRWIYEQIPSTVAEAYKGGMTLMKCAQVGFTIMELLAMIYFGLKFMPMQIGMYLPDMNLARIKSSERFMPIVRTIPAAHKIMRTADESGNKGGEGNIMIRNLGGSRYFFLWTSGKGSTESVPLDVLGLDEVQEMRVADMEKVAERMSGSSFRYTLAGSTANMPDRDIHFLYKKGTQHQFHTLCQACGESHVLDEYFPECIAYDPAREDYAYCCRTCKAFIDDPQIGEWKAKVPDAGRLSIHFPQFLSPTISARDIIEAYFSADDIKNFYNRKLGKPYLDPSQTPVNAEMLAACVLEGARLGVQWKTRGKGTYMGIDQMGAFNVALICERLPTGHMAIIHAEEIYGDDPFMRCSDLMHEFGVAVCVVETLPNYNDAKRFAGRHLGKVYLAGYGNMDGEMMVWGDVVPSAKDRKTEEQDRDRYKVRLDQYKAMQVAMARIQEKITVFPDPDGLVQEVCEKGVSGPKITVSVLRERVFLHLQRTALIAEKHPEEKKYTRRVVKIGIDPHFSYAYMLMNVAWARAHGTTKFLFSDGEEAAAPVEIGGGVSTHPVLTMMREDRAAAAAKPTCGSCAHYEEGRCQEHDFRVQPSDLECLQYMPAD